MSAFQKASTTVLPPLISAFFATVPPSATASALAPLLRSASSETGVPTQAAGKRRGAGLPTSLSHFSCACAEAAIAARNAGRRAKDRARTGTPLRNVLTEQYHMGRFAPREES